jgi:hypothetical protein
MAGGDNSLVATGGADRCQDLVAGLSEEDFWSGGERGQQGLATLCSTQSRRGPDLLQWSAGSQGSFHEAETFHQKDALGLAPPALVEASEAKNLGVAAGGEGGGVSQGKSSS